MARKRLLWQLYPAYLLLIILSLSAVGVYSSVMLRNVKIKNETENLVRSINILSDLLKQDVSNGNFDSVAEIIKKASIAAGRRFTLILPDGKVIADSEKSPLQMENHADRTEIKQALHGRIGTSRRISPTLGIEMIYAAIGIKHDGKIIAVLRAASPAGRLGNEIKGVYSHLILVAAATAVIAAVLSLMLAHKVSSTFGKMTEGAKRFAAGDFKIHIPVPDLREPGELAETLNAMAISLEERIKTIELQRNELKAVLSSMVEGVLVVDEQQQIKTINNAAANLLGIDPVGAAGQNTVILIRNIELQELVESVMKTGQTAEKDIMIYAESPRYVQVHCVSLQKTGGKGVVIVFNDITRIHRLENIRREFVSNVSHELKTPITSIKGFVETLLDGAVDNPQDARKFLDIIVRQTNRLNAIIEDILSLSRIEQESETGRMELNRGLIKEVLQSAVSACQIKAAEKQMQIKVECDDNLAAPINALLLEQAIVNLIDNAIKYSDAEKEISICAAGANGNIEIRITDNGFGIASEHIGRIFERFYVADKARSRTLGGTGLGLSIVKHIVSAHGGKISVQSVLGSGSTFTITIPA